MLNIVYYTKIIERFKIRMLFKVFALLVPTFLSTRDDTQKENIETWNIYLHFYNRTNTVPCLRTKSWMLLRNITFLVKSKQRMLNHNFLTAKPRAWINHTTSMLPSLPVLKIILSKENTISICKYICQRSR